MSSVRVDFACVRAGVGRLGWRVGPGDDEATGQAGRSRQVEEPLLNSMDSSIPRPALPKPKSPRSQTFKGLPAQNSCSECIMEEEEEKKKAATIMELCVSCTQTPPVNSSIISLSGEKARGGDFLSSLLFCAVSTVVSNFTWGQTSKCFFFFFRDNGNFTYAVNALNMLMNTEYAKILHYSGPSIVVCVSFKHAFLQWTGVKLCFTFPLKSLSLRWPPIHAESLCTPPPLHPHLHPPTFSETSLTLSRSSAQIFAFPQYHPH